MSMARRRLTAPEKRALLLPYASWRDRVAVNAFVRDIPMNAGHESRATLENAAQGIARFKSHPALIVWGGKDFCFNDHFYREWRGRLPRAEALYLADAGHYVLLDAAAEAVPRIAEFLR
jgi:haloalkane dehalogenase